MKYKRIGDLLIAAGLLNEEKLAEALEIQKISKDRLGKVLIDNNFITETQLIVALTMQLGIDYIDLNKVEIPHGMLNEIPGSIAQKYGIIPIEVNDGNLHIAMKDPLNFVAMEEASKASKKKIIPMISSESGIDHAINMLYGNEGATKAMAQMRAESGFIPPRLLSEIPEEESAAPTIRLVNSIIERAVIEKASDIHFEPGKDGMKVRMRIDGDLRNILVIPEDLRQPVISRIKVMGQMDISERRLPQDGHAEIKIRNQNIDMRISTLPTVYNEKAVIRLLLGDSTMLSREGIGIYDDDSDKLDKLMGVNNGVILIVGPTGSGKSSTMYTIIRELISEEINLITLEDPVEYKIDGAVQVQINEKTGLTFAGGLRSILRQDPDIIGIGEIRDGETAEIAMRAAMTGHLVISTIHTEDAISAIDRLRDMGVEPFLIAGGLRGVISQRLLKRICKNCKEPHLPDKDQLVMCGIDPEEDRQYYHGKGCAICFQTGYRGRIGVFEILALDDKLKDCISRGGTKQELASLVNDTNFVSMLKNGDKLIGKGITTVEEVCRVLARNIS
ncbi:MAG: GspE/PulE family protein [Eubacteriales bacterium]|nr:GspE/PulE family protein [Eubacteriales bacterium]MDD4389281.1 GspE/PulE family protein [Eubacteriales bacterium]